MEQFEWSSPWFVSLCAGVIGFVLGIAVMKLQQRRQAGGKSVEQLREEMEHYREEVSAHFAKTSDLFGDLNDKYRDVYNHLASGSQALCEDPMTHARLEFAKSKAQLSSDDADQDGAAATDPVQKNPSDATPAADTVTKKRVASDKI